VFNGGFASNGDSTITIDDNGTALTLVSTDTDAGLGPQLDLFRNPGQAGTDGDLIGQINFFGLNDASEQTHYLYLNAKMNDVANGSEDVRWALNGIMAGEDVSFIEFTAGTTATGADPELVFNNASKDINFRVESDDETHAIFVNAGDDVVNFFTTTTVNASSGVVGPDGVSHYADGRTDISRASGQPLNLRRRTDDGIIANFYKEASGTTADVGSIATQGGRLSIGSGDTNLNFNASANSMYPISNPTAGTLSDGVINVGAATARFKDLYLSGGVYLGGTGAANKLEDYEEGTWTPAVTSSSGSLTTVSAKLGTYIKVGTKITVFFQFLVEDVGNASGVLIISGASIPFVEDNSVISYYTGIIRSRSGNNVTVNSGIGETDPNGSFYLYGNQILVSTFHGQITFQTT
tara:strand:- start:38 stop:1261 length:1224 start_codon:yes stop_codon:yes gene_type:complete